MSPGCWQLFSFQSTFKVFKPALDGNLSKEAEVKSSCRCLSIFGCVVLNAFCRNSWTESIWGSLTASDWSEYTGTEWLVIRSWDLRPFGVLKTRPDGPDEFTKCAIFWLKHVQPFEEKWVVSALSCWDEARSSSVTSGRISLSIQVCQPPNQNSHAKVDGINNPLHLSSRKRPKKRRSLAELFARLLSGESESEAGMPICWMAFSITR